MRAANARQNVIAEARVWRVRHGGEVLCAKVYKDMAQRRCQARVQ